MRLARPWLPLPFGAPVERLLGAARGIPADAWRPADGVGERMCCDVLDCDASAAGIRDWLASIDVVWADVALLRFAPGAHTPSRVDARRAARDRLRIVVPLTPGWMLEADGGRMTFDAGHPVAIDTWRRHRLAHLAPTPGFALVADAYGEPRPAAGGASLRRARAGGATPDPWEAESIVGNLLGDVDAQDAGRVHGPLARFVRGWRGAWAAGVVAADATWLASVRMALREAGADGLRLRNGLGLAETIERQLFAPMVAATPSPGAGTAPRRRPDPEFDRPVFIISPPRAGSTLLFETLAQARGVVTIGDESHALIEGLPSLAPSARAFDSNVLGAADATPTVAAALRTRFMDQLRDRDGHRVDGCSPVRMLEKTPKNALRIPFLRAVFPEARFIHLHRDPRQVIASMIESWHSGRFNTYPALPGWNGPPWSLLLVPGWREFVDQPVPAIVGHQWAATMQVLIDDLDALPRSDVLDVDYAALLADPDAELRRICAWAGYEWDRALGVDLPLSRYTMSKPDAAKWRRHEADVEAQLAPHAALVARAAARLAGG